MTAMIKVHALQKHFIMHNQGGIRLPVFSDVAFDVSAGEALILHGESGVGKTSLLRILYGNYKPSSGHVIVRHGEDYIDLATATPRAILTVRRKTIRYVSQFLRVIPRVTTLDIVKDPLLARGIDDIMATEKAKDLLSRLNLAERLWHLAPATFSGGEQQRVNIARCFVDPASILLLDEPTASLDAKNRDVVVDLINEARESGAAIIGIFHDEYVRDRVATRRLDLTQFKKAA